MFKSIKLTCPRGHLYRVGRITPGLAVRIKGECPVCGELRIASGLVTPFSDFVVPTYNPSSLTDITSTTVRRELQSLAHHSEAVKTMRDLPFAAAPLTVVDIVAAMKVWTQHRGRPGGAVPEGRVSIQILDGTNRPSNSTRYLEKVHDRFLGRSVRPRPAPPTLGQVVEHVAPRAYQAVMNPIRRLPAALEVYLGGRG